jgi:hypothetical protein
MFISKKAIKRLSKGKVFKVSFIKKNGKLRNMSCRLDVKKYLKGGKSTTKNRDDVLTVFDMSLQEYRSIPLNRLCSFQCGDIKIESI